MGYFSSEYGVMARTVNNLTPQGFFSLEQNRLLMAHEQPFFEAEIDSLRAPDSQQLELATELTANITIGKDTGQEFGALWVNRTAEVTADTQPLIVINGFMGNLTAVDDKMRTYFLARAMPERQILVVEQLSHGLSAKFNHQQRADLCDHGDASSVGMAMQRAISGFVADKIPATTHAVLHGDSFGSRIGLDVAKADLNSNDGNLFSGMHIFELPGTRDRRFRIHGSYFGYEWLRSNNYRDEWVDGAKGQFIDYLNTYGELERPQHSFFQRDPGGALRNFWHSILGYSTGLAVLEELVDHKLPVTRIVGGASRIDNPVYARREWQELGGQFVLGLADHASHDALGALSYSRMRGRLIGSLLTYPLNSTTTTKPFSFNMVQLSGTDTVQPLAGKSIL